MIENGELPTCGFPFFFPIPQSEMMLTSAWEMYSHLWVGLMVLKPAFMGTGSSWGSLGGLYQDNCKDAFVVSVLFPTNPWGGGEEKHNLDHSKSVSHTIILNFWHLLSYLSTVKKLQATKRNKVFKENLCEGRVTTVYLYPNCWLCQRFQIGLWLGIFIGPMKSHWEN
jgi:hypothetical protein